jgi:hypothetical protein
MKCGREPGGNKVAELGTCRAATDTSFNGINNGINGGKICWAVAGTFSTIEAQGTFAKELGFCMKCDFYKMS